MEKKNKKTNLNFLLSRGGKIVLVLVGVLLIAWFSFNFILKPQMPPGFWEKAEAEEAPEEIAITHQELTEENGENLETGRLPEVEDKEIVLFLGGDVMLSRYVGQKSEEEKNYTLAWEQIRGETKKADLSLINLESPFCQADSYFVPDDSMVFKTDPQMMAGLIASGIDGASLANNHISNQGENGIEYTKEILKENGIKYSLNKPVYLKIKRSQKTYKMGMVAYNYNDGLSTEDLQKDLAEMAEKNLDLTIVSMHAGAEYVYEPGEQQINFAHQAIEAGADIVWGHHPHVVQTYEKYQDGYIFYSLGNLIFDQDWSEPTTEGVAVELTFAPEEELTLTQIEFKPIKIENNFQPRFMIEEEGQVVLQRLKVENYLVDPNQL